MRTATREASNALELLEVEDLELRDLFGELRQHRGNSVEDRAAYGDVAKEIVRHVATREAALVEVSKVAAQEPESSGFGERIGDAMIVRRPHIDRVEKMSRGVQGINLRTGQDFDEEIEALIQEVGTEIEWELDEMLPALRGALGRSDQETDMKSADHIRRHAPTNLDPDGPRWWERAPVVSRFITVYDHLRDFPRSRRQV
ncbi:MAG TPA: hypothetical protein VIY26_13710 [Acidimicrobiales bacterium]